MSELKGKRVLVVEDNLMNRAVFSIFFASREMSVIFDYFGKDTVFRLRGMQKVDLIILDLMLPGGISGFDVFAEIRAIPEYAAVPILIVSAADPSSAIPQAQERGLSGFIAKPIDDERFTLQLEDILAGKNVWFDGQR